jgi:hypothetical protein
MENDNDSDISMTDMVLSIQAQITELGKIEERSGKDHKTLQLS